MDTTNRNTLLPSAIADKGQLWFWLFVALFIGVIGLAGYFDFWFLYLIPFVLLIGAAVLFDYRLFYFLLFFTIPLSFEMMVSPSIGMDMPMELLTILTSVVVFWQLISKPEHYSAKLFLHPISLLLGCWLSWMLITTIYSQQLIVSVKFFTAKLWYLLCYFVGAFVFLNRVERLSGALKLIFVPLVVLVCIMLFRYSLLGFAFEDVEKVLGPTFRNHVSYASIIVCFLPYSRYLYVSGGKKFWYRIGFFVLLAGLIFAYTRAAYLALFGMLGMYVIVRWKLTKLAVIVGLAIPIVLSVYLVTNNKYLEFAPDYNKTVTHYNFEDLMEATTKGTDLSSMERVYRWVAARYMIEDKPWIGFGPGTFYFNYKPYTVNSFRTYVSDNPNKTGIHSYYLMTWVEQGYLGIMFYLLLIAAFFILAEKAYYRVQSSKLKGLVMASILSFTAITILQTLNDLIETDKVGPFFYLSLAIVVMVSTGFLDDENKLGCRD